MSVVVRMEMPENCLGCEMRGAWAFCPIGKWSVVGYKKQRHEDCPIICSLPEWHGRLVDADILGAKLIEHIAETNGFGNAFNETPTIVPAEAERKVDAPDAVAPTDTPTDTPTVPAERSET